MWRSWLAHQYGVLGVIGSSPVTPTLEVLMKNIKNYLPDLNSEHKFDNISDDISVYRDEFGIPHIKAKNSFDAFFGQGFATAQDRLWHMEYDRKRAYGKLSELVGESGLVNDEFMGKLNLVSNVKDDFDQLDTSTKEMYVAYSQGVNAYLNTKDTLPIEFELINLTMDPWQPWDSLAVFKVRHIMMGVFEGEKNLMLQNIFQMHLIILMI